MGLGLGRICIWIPVVTATGVGCWCKGPLTTAAGAVEFRQIALILVESVVSGLQDLLKFSREVRGNVGSLAGGELAKDLDEFGERSGEAVECR